MRRARPPTARWIASDGEHVMLKGPCPSFPKSNPCDSFSNPSWPASVSRASPSAGPICAFPSRRGSALGSQLKPRWRSVGGRSTCWCRCHQGTRFSCTSACRVRSGSIGIASRVTLTGTITSYSRCRPGPSLRSTTRGDLASWTSCRRPGCWLTRRSADLAPSRCHRTSVHLLWRKRAAAGRRR